jgi:hypothetical protein
MAALFMAAASFVFLPSGKAKASEGGDEKPAAEAAADKVEYLEIAPLVVPVINERGLTEQISIAVSLELAPGKKDAVNECKPRLVDAYLRDLYGAFGAGRIMVHGDRLDIEKLKARLTQITQTVMGNNDVSAVLLQAVQQRPMRSL